MKHLTQLSRTFVAQPSRPASSRSIPASSARAQCLGAKVLPLLAGPKACATRPGIRGCRPNAISGLTPVPPLHEPQGRARLSSARRLLSHPQPGALGTDAPYHYGVQGRRFTNGETLGYFRMSLRDTAPLFSPLPA